jgi:hypothetical protein
MNHTETSPADKVISLFGGVRPLARELGRNPSSVVRWRKPRAVGGTGGAVPSAMQGRILALAKARGLPLTAEDLIASDYAV